MYTGSIKGENKCLRQIVINYLHFSASENWLTELNAAISKFKRNTIELPTLRSLFSVRS